MGPNKCKKLFISQFKHISVSAKQAYLYISFVSVETKCIHCRAYENVFLWEYLGLHVHAINWTCIIRYVERERCTVSICWGCICFCSILWNHSYSWGPITGWKFSLSQLKQFWMSTECSRNVNWNPDFRHFSCMHVGANDARALRKTIKTAKTFTIMNISLSNLRYSCILMLPLI